MATTLLSAVPRHRGSCGCCNDRSEETNVDDFSDEVLDRDHSKGEAIAIACVLSMSIMIDILQYSMPLAFMPSVLEDRGHSTMKIATTIGVYYWTGFACGLLITTYQISLLFGHQKEMPSLQAARSGIWKLIIAVGVGAITLLCQAVSPTRFMHTACRFVQGGCGAFIFFYAFLLSVSMFRGQQQVMAMTMASIALNIAEVLGSLWGAIIYELWGERAVFSVLCIASILNQALLFAVMTLGVKGIHLPTAKPWEAESNMTTPMVSPRAGWIRVSTVLRSSRLICAVALITIAAVVKGAVEEMFPFHADHRWGFKPIEIGQLFSLVAASYITASVTTGYFWNRLPGLQLQAKFSCFWLAMLGLTAWGLFLTVSYTDRVSVLGMWLIAYGACLGLTHTPAALLLADAVDHEQGRAKDAVNAIWNTMWEAGGSLGFLLGGLFAEHYEGMLAMLHCCSGLCFVGAAVMLIIAFFPPDKVVSGSLSGSPALSVHDSMENSKDVYGSTDTSKVHTPLPK